MNPPRRDEFRHTRWITCRGLIGLAFWGAVLAGQPASCQDHHAADDGLSRPGFRVNLGQTQHPDHSSQDRFSTPNSAPGAHQDTPPTQITRVTKTASALPTDAGQVWREYDLTPYTSQIVNSEAPHQAVVDWILWQTGKDMWFREPLGFMSATREKLVVYHTPEIHNVILPMVDRFVYTHGQVQILDVHLITVGSPAWRETIYSALQPIETQSPGAEAWMVSKENAALLLNQLAGRSDFRLHAGGRLQIHDGQSTRLEKRDPQQFVRNLRWTPGQFPGYQPLLSQITSGYSLQLSTLSTLDGKIAEVALLCEIDQVEKLTPVRVNIPVGPGQVERVNLQIPSLVSCRFQERFRWPSDQVLVLSCGVVATPGVEGNARPLAGLFDAKGARADALLIIEYRGTAGVSSAANLSPIQR
ncbi:MAG TPA: hypothetical protein PKD54_00250 [Pirellulaceae bacterium]|nr:hypothetical protein [Pirellulaceae bacterium]